eukprot:6121521-Prymnesium_polylepis.1
MKGAQRGVATRWRAGDRPLCAVSPSWHGGVVLWKIDAEIVIIPAQFHRHSSSLEPKHTHCRLMCGGGG